MKKYYILKQFVGLTCIELYISPTFKKVKEYMDSLEITKEEAMCISKVNEYMKVSKEWKYIFGQLQEIYDAEHRKTIWYKNITPNHKKEE